jgi:hypothetical protein
MIPLGRFGPPAPPGKHHQLRVIDESGEDYLYPEEYLVPVQLPQACAQRPVPPLKCDGLSACVHHRSKWTLSLCPHRQHGFQLHPCPDGHRRTSSDAYSLSLWFSLSWVRRETHILGGPVSGGYVKGTFTPKLSNMFGTHGKGHAAFATWPLFMPATTYSPTHFRVQYNRPCGA